MLEVAVLSLFPGAMALAGSMDLFTMTIPNRISIALLIAFLIVAPFAGLGLEEIALHIACGFMILCITIFMFAMGWIGGGDAKIFAAASVWFGFAYVTWFFAVSALIGGGLTLGLLYLRQYPLPQVLLRQDWIDRLHHPQTGIPYGIAISAAAMIMYMDLPWVQAALL